jgi:hypothetical protein
MSPITFISANLWRAGCIASLAIAGVAIGAAGLQTARIDGVPFIGGGLKAELAGARREAKAQLDAHVQTIRSYRAAQAAAAAAEDARLVRVATDQERISDDVSRDYARRFADLRARAERLRSEAGADAGSAADRQPVSVVPAAAGGAAAPAGGDGLSLDRRLTASEQALQLDALIDWVERQAGIDPNERH